MGSVLWDANNLIQKVGENLEELGHVKYDETANEHVLWLRDWRNVFGASHGYVRGDSFPSMEEAKKCAAGSTSARLFHLMWLFGLRDHGQASEADVAYAIADSDLGRPLSESTFKEEMERAERRADERERKAKRRGWIQTIIAVVVGCFIGAFSSWYVGVADSI